MQKYLFSTGETFNEFLAVGLAFNNSQLYGVASQWFGFALAAGRGAGDILSSAHSYYGSRVWLLGQGVISAMKELVSIHPEPAKNADEFVERLCTWLKPAPNGITPIFSHLIKHKAFGVRDSGKIKCPGLEIAKNAFAARGRLLEDAEYRDAVQYVVSK